MTKIRIQKTLSQAGVASRRTVEQMILDGRITVNGQLVTTLPCFVDPACDDIRVDSRPVRKRPSEKLYFLLNKPRGVVCTQQDPQGRPRAVDLVAEGGRVYCAGRLDVDSTGLVLLTNDGELTQRLTHPRYGVSKTYLVEIEGRPEEHLLSRLRAGVFVGGRRTGRADVKVLRSGPTRSLLEIRIAEARNREVRSLLHKLGHSVLKLKRTAIGPLTGKGLKIGHYRPLSAREVQRLRQGVGGD